MSRYDETTESIGAVDALGQEFERVVPTLGHRRPRLTPAGRLVVSGLLIATVAFMSLTPPGRALAGEIGELVGIGEPSSVQDPDLRDPRLTETQERVGPALVAATGTIPRGERFEIVAWAAREKGHPTIDPQTGELEATGPASGEILSCLGVVYPDRGAQETGKWCTDTGAGDGPVHVFGMGGPAAAEAVGDPYEVIGVTEAEVERVSVTYENEEGSRVEAPVTFGEYDEELLEKTGATNPFGFFVAFIPYDGAPKPAGKDLVDSPYLESVSVTAFDGEGEVLEREDAGARYRRDLQDPHDRRARLKRCFELRKSGAPESEIRAACL